MTSDPHSVHSRSSARDVARSRKQRQRARMRARLQAEAEQAAARGEASPDVVIPESIRRAVITCTGEMVVGARVQVVDGMPVRALAPGTMHDPIGHRGPKSLTLTPLQRDAARELQLDWYDTGAGLGYGAMDYLRSGHSGESGTPPGHAAMLRQIQTRARLDAALTWLGAFAPGIVRVALDAIPVSVWACQVGKSQAEGSAWIAAGLTRLAAFYWPEGRGRENSGILTFGPSRADYSLAAQPEQ